MISSRAFVPVVAAAYGVLNYVASICVVATMPHDARAGLTGGRFVGRSSITLDHVLGLRRVVMGGIVLKVRGYVPRHPIDADLRRQPDQRRRQRRMLVDINLLTVGETAFQLLSQHSRSRKTPNELQARLAAQLLALVNQDGAGDVPVAPGDDTAAINIGQHVTTVGDPAPLWRLSLNDLRAISRRPYGYFHGQSSS